VGDPADDPSKDPHRRIGIIMQTGVVTQQMRRILADHARSHQGKAIWQLVNTILPCLALWVLMFLTLHVSYWLTLALSVVTAAFSVRTFIIFHDCGHSSFLHSRRANQVIGFFTGVLTLTPNHRWWADHSRHHATTGNLDRYGIGDVWMMTVEDYARSSWARRLWYRVYRHPFFMFIVGPFFIFAVLNRIPRFSGPRREIMSVVWTNLALIAIWVTLGLTVGIGSYLIIHIPVLAFSGIAGLGLFYVQHNYERAYWRRGDTHDYAEAALLGSSHLKLPRLLQWFSGNIGFHHIHHLSPRIPNYSLESCHQSLSDLPGVTTIGLRECLQTLSLRLWDDEAQRMISFSEYERQHA
jgi:omega-6 fatty acid desaturase (delta-12 desaturase)